MLRAAGAACLLTGAVCLGLSARSGLRERRETLEQLQGALTLLEEELAFRLTPMPVLLDRLGRSQEGRCALFFQTVSRGMRSDPERGLRSCWREGIREALPILREPERRCLEELGESLGRYDGESQRDVIRQTRSRLEEYLSQAREEQDRLGRIYLSVSLAGGLLAVIVLL